MQVGKEELMYQQAVLKHLGFYKGKVDGIWSKGSIDAKKKFEFTREFSPCIPTNGLPFGTNDRLPKNLFFKREGNLILLHHTELHDDALKQILGASPQPAIVEETVVVKDGPMLEEPTPVVLDSIQDKAAPVEEPKPVANPKPVPQQQRPQPNGNRR